MRRLISLLIVLGSAAMVLAAGSGGAFSFAGSPVAEQLASMEPLAIVVNRSNTVDDLSMAELHRIFLGQRSHWPNDRRITLVMRDPGQPERKAMLRDVFQMNETQLKNHFLHGLFTGEILVSPKVLSTPLGVRRFIFNVPGAIGYLRARDVDETVKVVRVDELLPTDKGYKLYVEAPPSN